MKKLFPLILALVGVGGGVGAGLALRPDPLAETHDAAATTDAHASEATVPDGTPTKAEDHGEGTLDDVEFIKLNNQFVIPIVVGDQVETLVIMSLSIELETGNSELVYRREPKLRDAFLQVLFDHANMGGFRGEFTNTANLDVLRSGLLEVAQGVVGKTVSGVLITDIARQDL